MKPSAPRSLAATAETSAQFEILVPGGPATQFRCALYLELLRLAARVLAEYREKDL